MDADKYIEVLTLIKQECHPPTGQAYFLKKYIALHLDLGEVEAFKAFDDDEEDEDTDEDSSPWYGGYL